MRLSDCCALSATMSTLTITRGGFVDSVVALTIHRTHTSACVLYGLVSSSLPTISLQLLQLPDSVFIRPDYFVNYYVLSDV